LPTKLSLELRSLNIDLIMCYKIVFGIVDVKFDDFFKRSSVVATRGHALKLFKEHSTNNIRQAFFSQRVINIWNALPEAIDFSSLWSFKTTVKLVDFTSFLKCFNCVIFVFAFMWACVFVCVCVRVLCALCHSFKVSCERRCKTVIYYQRLPPPCWRYAML